jgi:hypothetical protein
MPKSIFSVKTSQTRGRGITLAWQQLSTITLNAMKMKALDEQGTPFIVTWILFSSELQVCRYSQHDTRVGYILFGRGLLCTSMVASDKY